VGAQRGESRAINCVKWVKLWELRLGNVGESFSFSKHLPKNISSLPVVLSTLHAVEIASKITGEIQGKEWRMRSKFCIGRIRPTYLLNTTPKLFANALRILTAQPHGR